MSEVLKIKTTWPRNLWLSNGQLRAARSSPVSCPWRCPPKRCWDQAKQVGNLAEKPTGFEWTLNKLRSKWLVGTKYWSRFWFGHVWTNWSLEHFRATLQYVTCGEKNHGKQQECCQSGTTSAKIKVLCRWVKSCYLEACWNHFLSLLVTGNLMWTSPGGKFYQLDGSAASKDLAPRMLRLKSAQNKIKTQKFWMWIQKPTTKTARKYHRERSHEFVAFFSRNRCLLPLDH